MKPFALMLCALLPLSGCATNSALRRLEKRKHERSAAYAALSAEQKAAVDAGQLKIGMSMDAVYVAWGKPSQVMAGESAQGASVTWLYQGTHYQNYTYWTYGPGFRRGYYHYDVPGPRLAHDFYPVPYVRAEVTFEGGVVKQWRTLPSPGY